MLGVVDIIVIISYVLLVILVGYTSSREQTQEDFLISERKMGLWSSVATINATKTGTFVLGYIALLYVYGLSAVWIFAGILLGYLIFIPFAIKLHESSNRRYYTLADYFNEHYGKTAGYFSSGINILTMIAFASVTLVASAKVLEFFTGIEYIVSVTLVSVVVLTYLFLAGFSAVVKTDVLQYIAIVFILLFFGVILYQGSSVTSLEINFFSAPLGTIIGFLLVGALLPFASPDLWQRIYAMPDKTTIKKSISYSALLYFFVSLILTAIGLFVRTHFPAADPDIAIVIGFAELLPVGLTGLAVVVFFAAFMSSVDTYVYTASSSFIQNHFRKLSKEQTIDNIKKSVIVAIVIAALLAIFIQSLVDLSFMFTAIIILLAIPAIATWIKPSIKAMTLNISFLLGASLLAVIVAIDALQGILGPAMIGKSMAISLTSLTVGAIFSKALQNKEVRFLRFLQ